jgi:hypothetical protein
MTEEVSTMPENVETILEKVKKSVENEVKIAEKSEDVAAKKKGRPAGAKDKAPRAKKPRVVVVEEPVESQTRSAAKAAPPDIPAPTKHVEKQNVYVAPEVHEPYAPPSPRRILQEASRNILELKRLESSARRTHLGELFGSRLHTFVR